MGIAKSSNLQIVKSTNQQINKSFNIFVSMITYNLENIASITGGTAEGNTSLPVSQLLIDSRISSIPGSALFFALRGQRHDGHGYIADLYQRGIRAFVVSRRLAEFSALSGAGFVVVKDTLAALQDVARFHRSKFTCPVIAISGSNGKTIVKEWLNFCLSDDFNITRSPKSYNSQVGVPLSVWLMDEHTRLAIFEAGISMPGEMKNLQRIIRPDLGILTNIGEAHQENFTSLEQKVVEKLALFEGCRTLVYCHDHKIIRQCIPQIPELSGTRLFTWSVNEPADVRISEIVKQNGSTSFTARYGKNKLDLTIPYTDSASFENAMHCLSLMLLVETNPEIIRARLSELPPVAMRLEQKSAIHDCTLINDSYNSDINSLAIALDLLNRQVRHPHKTVILSDILQSGKPQHELYSTVAGMLKEKGIDRLIGIGGDLMQHADLFMIKAEFYETTEDFIRTFDFDQFRDEAILLKGSRRFEFERIAALLEQKKHTTRMEVNLGALVHNLNYFRSLLKPGTRTMVMVKALSYGSGRHEIASVLQFQRVDYLGVAFADEGISLRQAGITLPVIVMNPEPESFDMMIRHRLEPEIYSFRILELFNRAIARNQEIDYPVHIKIDTGMHRLGFTAAEIPRLCHELLRLRNLKVTTIFSHLAGSDEEEHDDFTHDQIESFGRTSGRIISDLGYPVIRHILNSSGIERFPEGQFDMVRLGIGLYGISTLAQEKLRNVSTLKSTILQVKPVYPGDTVGYGRKGKVIRPSEIAIVPVGYADGISRRLSNGQGHFYVGGTAVPIIGNICMDMTILDVSGTGTHEGDEVIIFGDDQPVSALAKTLDTIPYEILTGISERVKRVYLYE
jgi:Alr-MurF fusion protein